MIFRLLYEPESDMLRNSFAKIVELTKCDYLKLRLKIRAKLKLIEKYVIKLSGQVSNLLNYLH